MAGKERELMLKVVDENVLVIANDLTHISLGQPVRCPEASDDCRVTCVVALEDMIQHGDVVIDEGSEFLEKYRAQVSLAGQPGVGDAFLRFIFERGYDASWVTRVAIRENGSYRLPTEFMSSGFDNDDYLWVAAAHNAPAECEILNAVDSDYQIHHGALVALGVSVRELCPADLQVLE